MPNHPGQSTSHQVSRNIDGYRANSTHYSSLTACDSTSRLQALSRRPGAATPSRLCTRALSTNTSTMYGLTRTLQCPEVYILLRRMLKTTTLMSTSSSTTLPRGGHLKQVTFHFCLTFCRSSMRTTLSFDRLSCLIFPLFARCGIYLELSDHHHEVWTVRTSTFS